MKFISVLVDNELYAWVDTVFKYGHCSTSYAVLVNPKTGFVYEILISKIKVVDTDILI